MKYVLSDSAQHTPQQASRNLSSFAHCVDPYTPSASKLQNVTSLRVTSNLSHSTRGVDHYLPYVLKLPNVTPPRATRKQIQLHSNTSFPNTGITFCVEASVRDDIRATTPQLCTKVCDKAELRYSRMFATLILPHTRDVRSRRRNSMFYLHICAISFTH